MKEGKIPVIVKGEGVYVWDQAGRKYLDFVSAVTRVSHLGYGRKEIAQAMYDQACQLSYYSPFQFATQPAMEMADVLAEVAPGQISQFFFVCDGSESVEAALKLAKHYHYFRGDKQRHKVISRRGAYHGTTGGALRALGLDLAQAVAACTDLPPVPGRMERIDLAGAPLPVIDYPHTPDPVVESLAWPIAMWPWRLSSEASLKTCETSPMSL